MRRSTIASAMTLMLSCLIFGSAVAYDTYSGCINCHGDFKEGEYVSNVDGTQWGTHLMDGHESFITGNDGCDACHSGSGKKVVNLSFSDATAKPQGCVGCHGRVADETGICTFGAPDTSGKHCGSGAGLRLQHESSPSVPANTCYLCHSNDNGAVLVGEDSMPFNYGLVGIGLTSPCVGENIFGPTGLDNDGDDFVDDADSDCASAAKDIVLRRSTDNRWFAYSVSFKDNTNVMIEDKGFADMTRNASYQTVSRSDFDGDGIADVLVRDMVGDQNGRWVMYTLDGPTITTSGSVNLTRNVDWQVAASDDFDGDGMADVLMRNTADGRWLLYVLDSQTVTNQGVLAMSTDLTDSLVGTGDFNNDGRHDVLLRRTDGSWLMYELDGLAAPVASVPAMTSNLAFAVQSLADFNGDGNTDVLLRRDDGRWFMYELNGPTINNSGSMAMSENLAFGLASDSDFNGDGKADAMLRRNDGRWFLYSLNGVSVLGSGSLDMTQNPSFAVVSTADFNGDGKADMLLRRDDGRWVLYSLDGDTPAILGQGAPDMTRNEAWIPQME